MSIQRPKPKNIQQAVRFQCLECMGVNRTEDWDTQVMPYDDVKTCTDKLCFLFPYRFGKTRTKQNLTPEQRAAIGKRLKEARCKKTDPS